MKLKEIRKDSLHNLKKNFIYSFFICLIFGVFASLFLLLGINTFGYILFLVVPLLILPLRFSTSVNNFGLRKGKTPTFLNRFITFGVISVNLFVAHIGFLKHSYFRLLLF